MTATADSKTTLWGVRRSALLEIAVYLAAALLIDTLFFSGGRFRGIAPHPFWPVVILAAAQYGTTEALVAAAAATAALLAGHLPPQTVSQDGYDYLWAIVSTPLQWFVAGVVLGEIRMRHVRVRDDLARELGQARAGEEASALAYARLSTVKENLEARVAGQLRSAITMHQAARSLEKMDTSEVLLGVMEVVRIVLDPPKYSLYLLRDDVLEVCVGEGWAPEDAFSGVFASSSRLFQEVIGRQRVVCAASAADQQILGREGVLAGPVVDRQSGVVIGMLKIEEIGFLGLHFTAVQSFSALCEWIADAYMHARQFEAAETDSFVDPATRLLSYAVFQRLSDYLRALCSSMGLTFAVIRITLNDDGALAENVRRALRVRAAGAVRRTMRLTDLAFDGARTGCTIGLLMPGVDEAGSRNLRDRLARALKEDAPDASFSLTVQVAAPEETKRRPPEELPATPSGESSEAPHATH